jgi:hypothetical protein
MHGIISVLFGCKGVEATGGARKLFRPNKKFHYSYFASNITMINLRRKS